MAINTWAIAMVRYGEGVIGWTKVELEEMGRNARRELEKIKNYSELRVEIARVGNTETEVVPEVMLPLVLLLRICIATLKVSGLECISRRCSTQHCLVQLMGFLSELIDLTEIIIYDKSSSSNVYCEK